jgi:hypothetical protein
MIATWAVPKSDLNRFWFAYSRSGDPVPSEFSWAYAAGWLASRGLDPWYNKVEFV